MTSIKLFSFILSISTYKDYIGFILIFFCINLLFAQNGWGQKVLEEPVVSHAAGFYQSEFDLEISHPEEGVNIYYTLDGSTPSESSYLYTGPLHIQDRSSQPNVLSNIPTTFVDSRFRFMTPRDLIPKATVLRLKVIKEGFSPIFSTHSYFVFPEGKNKHTIPVISIVTDKDNFFGDRHGIYVPGNNYREGGDHTGNYYQRGRDWEHEMSFEFFDENSTRVIAQTVGVRIHGGTSRRYAHKSLRIYSRSDYDVSRLNHEIFPNEPYDSYKRLILRSSSQDQGHTMFRDAFIQSLVSHLNFDTQTSQASVVYINGEYWGIHNIRERYDDHYLERVYDVARDKVDLLEDQWVTEEGENRHYRQMFKFIDNYDMSKEDNIEDAKTRMDMESFLDYYSSQIYFSNFDWPHKNIKYWRYQAPSYAPDADYGQDGRWRWMLFDVDEAFRYPRSNMFGRESILEYLTDSKGAGGNDWSNTILRNLLENEKFKHDFINRMGDLLNSAFKTERVIHELNSYTEIYEPEMPEYINRWNRPVNMNRWRTEIDGLYDFAENRPKHLINEILHHFDIPSTVDITIDNTFLERSPVQVNSVLISSSTPGINESPYPWTGTYFSGIPVTLTAPDYPSVEFKHWLINDTKIYNAIVEVLPDTTQTIQAVYEDSDIINIEPFPLANDNYFFNSWDKNEPAASYPEAMAFVYMDTTDPGLHASIAGLTWGEYDHDSRTRINGLDEDGFSFINTSNPDGNLGYPGTRLGGALLMLDTRETSSASIRFEAGTITPNSRIYNLRLQYRIGSEGSFSDLLDTDGQPIEYKRHVKSHSEIIGPITLSDQLIGQERVELLWRYYYTGNQLDDNSGARSELNISMIHVERVPEKLVPEPYALDEGSYNFNYWPADTTAASSPKSMKFVFMDEDDPGINANILGFTSGVFDLSSRSRVNGLGNLGFSFINTSNQIGNPGYPGRRLGGAILALNTIDRTSISVEWTGSTINPNSRIYHLRLQYRTSPDEPFQDVLDHEGRPVEYKRNENSGHSQALGPVLLPTVMENKPYVQLFWRYYYTQVRESEESGQRSQLAISQIKIDSFPLMGGEPGQPSEFTLHQNYPNPFYPATTIRFDIPEKQHVKIQLYSITGQHIVTLVENNFEAGRHAIDVDVSSLASGVYLYKLDSDQFSETKKMSLIK